MSLEQSIQDLITASGQQTEAANQLNATVNGKIASIDGKVAAKEAEVDAYLVNAAEHIPLVRTSTNQFGNIDAATKNLQGWNKNAAFTIEVSLLDTIASGTDFDLRPIEHQNILNAMGHQATHFIPNIQILKMIWSGWNATMNPHTIYPSSAIPAFRHQTIASYARLIDGSISNEFLHGVNNEWGLCGRHDDHYNGGYVIPHPYVASEQGEVHFFWPAVAEGHVPLDRNNPSWAWMPSIYGTGPTDTSI